MKKLFSLVILVFLLAMLTACKHIHIWGEATCVSPPVCKICGIVQEGAIALGHDWRDATCSSPKKCVRCELTEGIMLQHTFSDPTCEKPKICTGCGLEDGKPLGHDVDVWTTTKESTCSQKGTQEAVCGKCNQTVTQKIDCIAHTPGEWEISKHPTSLSDGVRVQKCTVCGGIAKEERYSLTMEQKNALRKAESYLSIMAFSKEGLIDQLEYEGFSKEDAIFAVDNIKVDWKEQCYKKAEDYLDIMAFSRKGLIQQLEYEGFSEEEVIFAVDNVKVDWKEQCYKKAKDYLDTMSFSKNGLINQLKYEGYTDEQIAYAIQKVGY